MGRKYTAPKDGQWVKPVMQGYRLACCDCGLVHDLDFEIFHGRVYFRAKRNYRSTAQKRRYRKVKNG
jgi:hypothetical protein